MVKVILARHAETVWNEEGRYIGRTDLDLSPLGRENAALLASSIKDLPLAAVYASGMKRAIQTAAAVADSRGLIPQSEPLLNEIDFGYWEGLTHEEIAGAYPGLVEDWMGDPFTVDIPGGEPWPDFARRVWLGWDKLTREAKDGPTPRNVIIVTHAGCIKVILGQILDLTSDLWWKIYQDKGALNHLVVDMDRSRVIRINDTDYRRPPEAAVGWAVQRCEPSDAAKIHFVIEKSSIALDEAMEPDLQNGERLSLDQLKAEMDRMTFFAIENGGIFLGVMAYEALLNVALLRHAYVLPACQRQGFGGRLLSHIAGVAAADGYSQLLVGTYADNAGAIDFYEKHGFEPADEPQALLARHWQIPERQAARSLVFKKAL